ncbi:MAG: helix-turn-helix transcriptional regulator [Phycisphaeraceae bacterium]|nr:helix-turn-helix transcriptional regulator [Phycisphaeraceae bacterium]
MAEGGSYPGVGGGVVERVLLCDQYVRRPAGIRMTATSLPGHLIQLTVCGRAWHEIEGRAYDIRPGTLIWYHENEEVKVHVLEAPWRFFTLNFIASQLSPPRFEDRVRRVGVTVRKQFESLLRNWRNMNTPAHVRELRVQASLLNLLATLAEAGHAVACTTDPSAQLWWQLETELRRNLRRPVSLKEMSRLTGRSPATIARSCRNALGVPPMKRIKQIRLSLARGLVQRSDLTISQIADRIGYGRVHEFSRDYHKHFGRPPREDRRDAHALIP